MQNGSSLAAMELLIFLGLAGWLLYYQYSSSRRGPNTTDTEQSADSPESDEKDTAPPGS